MKLVSGSSNPQLASKIAKHLDIELIPTEISKFSNDEKRVWIQGSVAGDNVCLVQSHNLPVDENIVETLLLIDALERAGARHVSLVIPWLGYSLQDKVFRNGEPISAKVIADMISNSYVKRVILLDLHNSSIPGFFSIPTHHLLALQPFVNYARSNYDLMNAVVVSPDFGGLKRARTFAETLELELMNIDKQRVDGKVMTRGISGDVSGKICLIYDDVINSGGTVVEVAKLLKEKGAKEVHFLVTHALFAGEGLAKMADKNIDSVVITNSVHHENLPDKIKTADISGILADSLKTWI